MNRALLIILIIIAVIIIIGLILFFTVGKDDVSKIPAISDFFPKSEERKKIPIKEGETTTETTIISGEEQEQKIIQLSDKPVAGAVFSAKNNKVRYLEKISGHLYEVDFNGQNKNRISNTTILNIFDAVWSFDSQKAVLRIVKDNELNYFSVHFTGSTTEGIFLSKNIKSIATAPKENKIAYLEDAGGRGIIFTADFIPRNGISQSEKNQNKKQIFSLPLTDFILFWQDGANLSLLTKPSAKESGILYSLNLTNKNLEKSREANGLNVLWSKTGKEFFMSQGVNGNIQNAVFLAENNQEYNLSVKTMPEKCVWSAKEAEIMYCGVPLALAAGDYPDDWYQGKISFKDALYRINFKTGENNLIAEEIIDMDFDIVSPFLNSDETYFFFTNKKDSSLWSVGLNE